MEASVVVCEPLKPPRLCHIENQPEVRKTATQKRACGARAVLCAVRAVRLFPPLLVCCCVLQISGIQGTPLSPV